MTPIEITIQILSILASFAAGAWTGKSTCKVALAVDTSDDKESSWVKNVMPCVPKPTCMDRQESA